MFTIAVLVIFAPIPPIWLSAFVGRTVSRTPNLKSLPSRANDMPWRRNRWTSQTEDIGLQLSVESTTRHRNGFQLRTRSDAIAAGRVQNFILRVQAALPLT